MTWFYALEGQRSGPADDQAFARLVDDGIVNDATLVWHAGLSGWLPYAQVRTLASPARSPEPGMAQAQCSQCGGVLPADEVIRLEGFNVCSACKPVLLEKMSLGISPAIGAWGVSPARPGGFWIRVGAAILDSVIMLPIGLVALFLFNLWTHAPITRRYGYFSFHEDQVVLQLANFSLYALYSIFFTGRFGGTPGKLICGLRVVRPDESRITSAFAANRFFAAYLNLLTLGLSYVIVGFDEQKRGLHDFICDTWVIHK